MNKELIKLDEALEHLLRFWLAGQNGLVQGFSYDGAEKLVVISDETNPDEQWEFGQLCAEFLATFELDYAVISATNTRFELHAQGEELISNRRILSMMKSYAIGYRTEDSNLCEDEFDGISAERAIESWKSECGNCTIVSVEEINPDGSRNVIGGWRGTKS
jgi:hypothetical protein